MTITTQYAPVRTVGNGVTVAFPFSFRLDDSSELQSFLIDTEATTNKDLQVIGSGNDYTLVINTTTEGGTVTFNTPPPDTRDVLLEKVMANTQPTNIPDVGTIRESQIEGADDRTVQLVQQNTELLGRQFTVSVADDTNLTVDYAFPTPVNNRALFWTLSGSNASITNSSQDLTDIDASVTAAALSETNAATSETNAATSAANALVSENAASASAVSAAASSDGIVVSNVNWACTSDEVATVEQGTRFKGVATGTFFTFAGDQVFDITTTGAGGLNTGSAAADTLYYLLGIGASGGGNPTDVMAITEANYAAFVVGGLPSGYDDYKRIGWLLTDATSDLLKVRYVDGEGFISDPTQFTKNTTSNTFVDTDWSALIPAGIVRRAQFVFTRTATSSSQIRYNGSPNNGFELANGSVAAITHHINWEFDENGIFEWNVTAGTLSGLLLSFIDDLVTEGQ